MDTPILDVPGIHLASGTTQLTCMIAARLARLP